MIQNLDIVILRWFNSWVGTGWDWAIIFRAVYLWYLVMVAVVLLVFITFLPKFRDYRRRHLELFISVIFSAFIARFIVTELIRFFYHRPRPFEVLEGVRVLQHQLFGSATGVGSFPSGHAALAFAVATAFFFYYPRLSILFFLAALSVGGGRIAAGVHWPSDILGGAVVGIVTTILLRMLWRYIKKGRSASAYS